MFFPLCLVFVGLLTFFSSFLAQADCVVLLHGLARTSNSMIIVEDHLLDEGYHVANIDYPSTKHSIEALAPLAIEKGVRRCHNLGKVHFVTHSLGGILVRQYLQSNQIPKLGRVVMMGPPNQGSEVVDKLAEIPGTEWINLAAGKQLGTGPNSLPLRLGKARFDLGVIAGTKTTNPLMSKYLPDPDDGKVSVASTRVDGMNDHLVLPVSHSFMMRDANVIGQILHYLKKGKFYR